MPFPYKLHDPDERESLSSKLDEISGIYPLGRNHLLCVEDETRDIYEIKKGKIVERFRSGKAGDSEDIVVIGDDAFILEARKRAIYEYRNFRKSMAKVRKHDLDLDEITDPEGLCHDRRNDCLLVACKGGRKKGSSKRAVFKFDLEKRERQSKPYFTIDSKALREKGEKEDFNPSAIAIHPKTREIYLLGSRGLKMVVRLDRKGRKIIDFMCLREKEYGQPEGLGFTKNGDLYLSSEAKNGKSAKLYRFNK